MSSFIQQVCQKKKITIATAESCTGGNIAHQITSESGSSAYFLGGVVSYANDVKVKVLNVAQSDLDAFGAVSLPVAKQMVQGVIQAFNADFAVSTTGIAGPSGGSIEKPVGTVWIGVGNRDAQKASKYLFSGSRAEIIEKTTQQALLDLVKFIDEF